MKCKGPLVTIIILCILIAAYKIYNETDAPKKYPVIEKAYSQIKPQDERNTIINWKKSIVEEIDFTKGKAHEVFNMDTGKHVDLKDRKVYRVTFRVKSNSVLGDIYVYVDKESNEVLGADVRD